MTQPHSIRQPWLTIARAVWVVLTLYSLLPGLLGLPLYYQQLAALDPWPNRQGWTQETFSAAVARASFDPQVVAWLIFIPGVVSMLVFLGLGLLIFWRKSNDWRGLLVSYVFIGLSGTYTGAQTQLLDGLPFALQMMVNEARFLIWLAFLLFLILFPDGRFVPGWTRWVTVALVIWFISIEGYRMSTGQDPVWISAIGFILLALLIYAKVDRYRRFSNQVERQQIRWFVFAVVIMVLFNLLHNVWDAAFPLPAQPGAPEILSYLSLVYLSDVIFLLIPVSIGVAIFRYRLYDIDLIIRRTLQYGLLSLLLGLVYFGLVVVLGQVFQAATGQQSPLAVVISTLAIVVLFTPLRRRAQQIIDRRFYRQRYDAGQAVAEFAAVARNQVKLDTLAGLLAKTAQETLEPEGVWVWIKEKNP